MNIRITTLALALMAAASPALAAGNDDPVRVLARETGLSERKVQMILGTRTAFAEYPYTYARSVERLRSAIGRDRYDQLMGGRLIAATPREKAEALLAVLEDRGNTVP